MFINLREKKKRGEMFNIFTDPVIHEVIDFICIYAYFEGAFFDYVDRFGGIALEEDGFVFDEFLAVVNRIEDS